MLKQVKHSGVLGMKWGVRKSTLLKGSSDHLNYSAIRTKKLKNMSDEELQTVVKRIKLVHEYKRGSVVSSKVLKAKTMSNEELESANKKNRLKTRLLKEQFLSGLMKFKEVNKMSDSQVDKMLQRLNLEKEFKSIASADIQSASKFLSFFLGAF